MEVNLAIFLLVMALMSFPPNFATAIDAQVHPHETINDICLLSTTWQLVFSFAALAAAGPFFASGLRKLTALENIRRPWLLFSALTFMILAINVYIAPQRYETLHVNRMYSIFLFSQFFFLAILIFIYGIFYMVMQETDRAANERNRLQYLEMQESQYHSQQLYMEETSRLRHDFRQQVRVMAGMAEKKEYEKLGGYIRSLSDALPRQVTAWCANVPVNALLNHYETIMKEKSIRLNWNIGLPADTGSITDMDLCSLLGNIIENAYYGCLTVSAEQRWHDLIVRPEGRNHLFIVSANRFDGNVKKKDGIYRSTRRHGQGIGLSSIKNIAEKYGGTAGFSNTDSEFRTDVMLEMKE